MGDDLASSLKDDRCITVNIGTGKGYSVLEMIRGLEKACGKEIPQKLCPRRAGDVASRYADASLALSTLGWKAELTLDDCAEICGTGKRRTRWVTPRCRATTATPTAAGRESNPSSMGNRNLSTAMETAD